MESSGSSTGTTELLDASLLDEGVLGFCHHLRAPALTFAWQNSVQISSRQVTTPLKLSLARQPGIVWGQRDDQHRRSIALDPWVASEHFIPRLLLLLLLVVVRHSPDGGGNL